MTTASFTMRYFIVCVVYILLSVFVMKSRELSLKLCTSHNSRHQPGIRKALCQEAPTAELRMTTKKGPSSYGLLRVTVNKGSDSEYTKIFPDSIYSERKYQNSFNKPCYLFNNSEGKCMEQERQQVIEYSLQILVYNFTLLYQHQGLNDTSEWQTLAESFKTFATRLAQAGNVSRFIFSVGLFSETPRWWQQWNDPTVPIYVSVRMQVNVNETNQDDYSESVLSVLRDQITLTMEGQLINIEFKLFNGSYDVKNEINFFPDVVSGECCTAGNSSVKYEDIQVSSGELVFHEMSCPYVQLTEKEGYELVNGGLRLVFGEHKSPVVTETYTFHGDDMITICMDIYERYYNDTWKSIQKLRYFTKGTEWAVDVICLTLSLVCLFLAFLTYAMFPSLRTVPGQNNMGLIICLFVTQLVFLTGYLEKANDLLCQVAGVTLHYFWLASLLWMNICSFYVFKIFVLSKTVARCPMKSNSIFFRHFLYANGLPVLIVCTVIITNQILSEGKDSGYGAYECFLSTPLLLGMTAILPLCAVLLSNFVFFFAIIYTISKTKQTHRSTSGERRNLWIYIKLSSITGLFWIFAILEANLNIKVLTYISIVLNSGHGVLIFTAYCCNKTIIDLWKNKLTGRVITESGEKNKSQKN